MLNFQKARLAGDQKASWWPCSARLWALQGDRSQPSLRWEMDPPALFLGGWCWLFRGKCPICFSVLVGGWLPLLLFCLLWAFCEGFCSESKCLLTHAPTQKNILVEFVLWCRTMGMFLWLPLILKLPFSFLPHIKFLDKPIRVLSFPFNCLLGFMTQQLQANQPCAAIDLYCWPLGCVNRRN